MKTFHVLAVVALLAAGATSAAAQGVTLEFQGGGKGPPARAERLGESDPR
jgi:hypothetical protein